MSSTSQWATAALQFPTMAVCVIDTTGIQPDADIVRVYVATTGGEIYDRLLWSERHGNANTQYTGIDGGVLLGAPSLTEEWEHLKATLTSHYILSYNLDFVQERLDENAAHYSLEPFALIGDDVQHIAVEYFHSGYNLSLKDACDRIGHPMPTPAMAQDRATALLALLAAMAANYEMETHPF